MTELTTFLEPYVPLLEKYVLANDQNQFIKNLPIGKQKELLIFLKEDEPKYFQDKCKELRIPNNIWSDLKNNKLFKLLRQQSLKEETKQNILTRIKELFAHLNFVYPKPAQLSSLAESNQQQDNNKIPSELQLQTSLELLLEKKLKQRENNFDIISDYALRRLPEKVLKDIHLNNKLKMLQKPTIFVGRNDSFISDFISQVMEECVKAKKVNSVNEIPMQLLEVLNKSQINALKKKMPTLLNDPNFMKIWFNRNYSQSLSYFATSHKLTFTQKEKKRNLLEQIIKDLKKLDTAFVRDFEDQFFMEILVLDLSINDPKIELFVQYLKNIRTTNSLLKKDYIAEVQKKNQLKHGQQYYDCNISNLQCKSWSGEKIINEYVIGLFKKETEAQKVTKTLEKYISDLVLQKVEVKVRLSRGQQVEQLLKIFSDGELNQLKESKQIKLQNDKNKLNFAVQEDIILNLKVKNVPQIKVKIYEINLQKYYLQTFTEIDETINLSFLKPMTSYQYNINSANPYKVQEHQICIDKVQKKRGLFIIQFEGSGLTSRAVIQKGAIISFERRTSAGVQLKFYDEKGTNIQQLKLWVNGRCFSVNKRHIIPYGQKYENRQIVAVYGDYAQLLCVAVQNEEYQLNVGYIYHSESFLVGQKAKIVIHPRLKLQGFNTSLKLLKNTKISLQLTNSQNIKSELSFENIQWKQKQDYILEFPIQSYLNKIRINIQSQIKLLSGKTINLTHNKNISIDLGQSKSSFIDLYLQKQNNSATLSVLGMGGEPIPHVDVQLNYEYDGFSKEESLRLQTDRKGTIKLNGLRLLTRISANVSTNTGNINKTWNMMNNSMLDCFPSNQLHYKKDEPISLPFPQELNKYDIILYRIKEQIGIIQDYSETIKINKNRMEIKGIPKGTYTLLLLLSMTNIKIHVHQGKQWDKQNQVYDQKSGLVYEIMKNTNSMISLGNIRMNRVEDSNQVSVQVSFPQGISNQHIRAHIFPMNYRQPKIKDQFQCEQFNEPITTQIRTFKQQKCIFYNNKTLSDQSAYVLNRFKENKFIGNNLQKPKLFLKKIQIRDTSQKDEQLQKEGRFGESPGMYLSDARRCLQSKSIQNNVYGKAIQVNQLNSHNNFLLKSGLSLLNIKPQNGTLNFKVPIGYHSYKVLLISPISAVQRTYDIQQQPQQRKDLRHTGIRNKEGETGLTMSRESYQLQNGEKLQINRDSLWSTVSLHNIANYAKINGHTLPQWLLKWNTYTLEKKNQVYDKEVCHQLNAFIRQNDLQYFESTVKKFIQNKVTRTFVDCCLLDDTTCFVKAKSHSLSKLNQFEKVLLIKQLIKNERIEQAQQIAKAMSLTQKCMKRSFEEFKNKFDTIINAKLVQQSSKLQERMIGRGELFMKNKKGKGKICSEQDQKKMSMPMQMKLMEQEQCYAIPYGGMQCQAIQQCDLLEIRDKAYKPGFQQMQKTKQYTEVTYSGVKDPYASVHLIMPSEFWAELAVHIASGTRKLFLTESFMYLKTKVDFVLAACFLPNKVNALFDITNDNKGLTIEAKSTFLVFVKEVRALPFESKFGVLIKQRFFNPKDRYNYEQDGTQVQKQVNEFIVRSVYALQTVVTNTSGTKLQLQLLVDIPEGALPLRSHEYTQIQNITINAYSTASFERQFYFPCECTFSFYPANTCRGKTIIAKADNLKSIEVKSKETIKKLESFSDVMKSGTQSEILQYISNKNIFDSKLFVPYSILWMLKDQAFFTKVIAKLRERYFFDANIWSFGVYHGNLECIREYIQNQQRLKQFQLPILEYYPYYSNRSHKFMNEGKSTIRNVQLKQTYSTFLFCSAFENDHNSRFKVTMAYYLLLQDRIDEASKMFSNLSEKQRQCHQLQCDYFECFLDMYKGYPNFTYARKISSLYIQYPILEWRKLFVEIVNTLKQFDSADLVEQTKEKKSQVSYETTVINSGKEIKLSVPLATKVQVSFFEINLQLYFSQYPFSEVKSFSSLKPAINLVFAEGDARQEKIIRSQLQETMKDFITEIYEFKQGLPARKVEVILWVNPNIKTKVTQNEGIIQTFYKGKQIPGAYCKVYSKGSNGIKFYRDGYTDIIGRFKYALADLQGISQFAILVMLEQGGSITTVKAPQQTGFYAQ